MKLRRTYFGDWEQEFESYMHTIIGFLHGWKQAKELSGMLVTPLVLGIRIEEQARFSSHVHMCVLYSSLKAFKQCQCVRRVQFVNMGNDIASRALGCSTNVGDVDRAGCIYVSM